VADRPSTELAADRPDTGGAAEPIILVEDDGVVRVITLNRPQRLNAIDLALRVRLAEAIEAAMADDAVRVLILTGAGGAFCSGGDISTMTRLPEHEARPRAEAAQRVIRALWNGDKPVIAAIEGAAMGAGLALALACDRAVAGADARFGTSFSRVGLAGDMGIFATLPNRIGPAAARQMLMFAGQVDASEAARIGLVDAVVEPGKALASALDDARRLAAGPPLALAAVKSMLARWPRDPFEVLGDEVDHQVTLFDSDDFAEGARAYHERRTPIFRGRQRPFP
jgi:2-(1,2-epoxy-1,2-dihydrophenyl)acetyl-CoA isomerase